MIGDLILLILSCILSFVLYPFWINFLYKFKIGQKERLEGPKSHLKKEGTPTAGGVVFVLVVAFLTLVFSLDNSQAILLLVILLLGFLFGIFEDLTKVYARSNLRNSIRASVTPIVTRSKLASKTYNKLLLPWDLFKEFWRTVGSKSDNGLQTYQKFLMQAAVAGLVAYWTYFKFNWHEVWLPFIGFVDFEVFYIPFIFTLFISVINAFNITDGLDGLVGGLSIMSFLAFWTLASSLGYLQVARFCAIFIGSLIAFMYFNIYPARIFMGNVGSFALGASFAIVAILLRREVSLLFICGVVAVDGVSSIAQQLSVRITGKRILRMAPIHHHFELLGWPETKVTMRFWLAGIFLAFFGLLISLL